MMLSKFKKSESGFTLIELLIVVAIIGILAAVAIPQFSAYRQRAYNSASVSDVRNMGTAQEGLFADTTGYGSMNDGKSTAAVGTPTAAAAVIGSDTKGTRGATDVISGACLHNDLGFMAFSLSSGVKVGCSVVVQGATAGTDQTGSAYVIVSKHLKGDRAYGKDSDSTAVYKATHKAKTALVAADVPGAADGTVKLTGDTGAAKAWIEM